VECDLGLPFDGEEDGEGLEVGVKEAGGDFAWHPEADVETGKFNDKGISIIQVYTPLG